MVSRTAAASTNSWESPRLNPSEIGSSTRVVLGAREFAARDRPHFANHRVVRLDTKAAHAVAAGDRHDAKVRHGLAEVFAGVGRELRQRRLDLVDALEILAVLAVDGDELAGERDALVWISQASARTSTWRPISMPATSGA
jgi:hypothetical protein